MVLGIFGLTSYVDSRAFPQVRDPGPNESPFREIICSLVTSDYWRERPFYTGGSPTFVLVPLSRR